MVSDSSAVKQARRAGCTPLVESVATQPAHMVERACRSAVACLAHPPPLGRFPFARSRLADAAVFDIYGDLFRIRRNDHAFRPQLSWQSCTYTIVRYDCCLRDGFGEGRDSKKRLRDLGYAAEMAPHWGILLGAGWRTLHHLAAALQEPLSLFSVAGSRSDSAHRHESLCPD